MKKQKNKMKWNYKKFIRNMLVLGLTIATIIVFVNRCQDITGVDWFFTTIK